MSRSFNVPHPFATVMRYTALTIMWAVSFPITLSALFDTESCNNGCENGKRSCAGKSLYSVILLFIVGLIAFHCYQMHTLLKGNKDFDWHAFFSINWEEALQCCSWRTATEENPADYVNAPQQEGNDAETTRLVWEEVRKVWKMIYLLSWCVNHGHFRQFLLLLWSRKPD